MDLGLRNATAVVDGGGRGMGLAAARCLADDGARVAGISRSRADLDPATYDLTARGSPEALHTAAECDSAGVRRGQAALTSVSKSLSLLLAEGGHPAHLPRAGLPDEMGAVVAIFASRCNSYMTGANVNVDGGPDFT